MSYYGMDCDYALREESEWEEHMEDNPHDGDAESAAAVEKILTPEVIAALTLALAKVMSNDGEAALTQLVDEAIPAIQVWLSDCREEGEI
jgi:hypothetical protein